MAQQNCQEETTSSENPPLGVNQPQGAKICGEPQGELEGFQPKETKDDVEARVDFWSIQGDFIYRHHSELRVQLFVPMDETFPIPLKYIDVTRSTHTDLDVLQEKRTDDYWNVDLNKHLSDSLKGFTKFGLLKESPPKRKNVVRRETDKDSSDNQTRTCVARSVDENW